ncbi:MAG: hypothetical protein AAGG48_29620 [Planctomycetota bacterium]
MNEADCIALIKSLIERAGLPNGFAQDSDTHGKGWFRSYTVPPAAVSMDASEDASGDEVTVEVDVQCEGNELKTVVVREDSSHSFAVNLRDATEEKLQSEFKEACYQVLAVD